MLAVHRKNCWQRAGNCFLPFVFLKKYLLYNAWSVWLFLGNGAWIMIYTEMTKKAIRIAYNAHQGQWDKSGIPYIFHPYHLAEQMDTEETVITALLHDVMEDTPVTLEELRDAGFSEEVLTALVLLTHDRDVPYMDYIQALKGNHIARKVKLADLRHNSDVSRLLEVDTWMREHLIKYRKALEYLEAEECVS